MSNGNGKAVKEISLDQLNNFIINQPEVHNTSSLTYGGTSAVKDHTSGIQNNFSHVTDVESNSTYQRNELIIPNHTSITIKTPESVGAGLKTFIAFEQIKSDFEIQGEILKSLMGIFKVFYCSKFGGTGTALSLYVFLNLYRFLNKDEKLFLINSIPKSIQGTPIQKYYLSTAIEQIYTENKSNILSLYMPEYKISSFLEAGFLEIIYIISTNIINMKGANKSNRKVVVLDYNESNSNDFDKYAFKITEKKIKSALYYSFDSNIKINHELLYEELASYIRINSISLTEIESFIQHCRNAKEFQDVLYQRKYSIDRENLEQAASFSRRLLEVIKQIGFVNVKESLTAILNQLKDNKQGDMSTPNWERLYSLRKKHPGLFFNLFLRLFDRKEAGASDELNKAIHYISADIKNRFISEISILLQNLIKFFDTEFEDELNYELNIDLNNATDINDIIKPKAFEQLLNHNLKLNYKNILFFYVIHVLDEVKLENYASYEEFNNGMIIQAQFIDALSESEKNMLYEKIKRKFNSPYVDLVPKLRESDLEFRIIRYCFVPQMDRINIVKQVINQVNSSYYDFSKINPIYFATTSKHDLLLSKLRTEESNYKIIDEDRFYFMLQCYSLNIVNINKTGFSISHPGNALKNYTSLTELTNMLSYSEQEEIRKKFIMKFFDNPITVIKKLEDLGTKSSKGSGKIITDPALHKIFKSQLRELLSYSNGFVEILNYLREHYG